MANKIDFIETQWMQQSFSSLDKYLKELSEDSYKDFSQRLIPNCNNMIGIRIPILRDIAKQIAKGDWRSFVSLIDDKYFENVMIHGFVLGYAKVSCDERIEYIKKFIPKINNWSVCDSACSGFKFVKNSRQEVLEFLQTYINSKKEFEVRFAVVMLMDYFLTNEYIDMVLNVLQEIKHDGYYVKMAVAWAISVCFVKYREKTMKIICSQSFDDETLKMAFQKIIESKRVDEHIKEQIRGLKKIVVNQIKI